MIINKNASEDLETLLDDDVTLVDVYATWCGPCKMIAPNIERINKELDIKVVKVDADENFDVANEYKVNSIPTLLLFKNKKLVAETLGYKEFEEIKEWILQNNK